LCQLKNFARFPRGGLSERRGDSEYGPILARE